MEASDLALRMYRVNTDTEDEIQSEAVKMQPRSFPYEQASPESSSCFSPESLLHLHIAPGFST